MDSHNTSKRTVLFVLIVVVLQLLSILVLSTPSLYANRIIRAPALIVCAVYCVVGWLFAASDVQEAFDKFKRTGPNERPDMDFTFFAPLRFFFAMALWPFAMLFDESNED